MRFQDLDHAEKGRVLDSLVQAVRDAGQVAHAHYEGRHGGECVGLRFASDGCPKFFRLTSRMANTQAFILGEPSVMVWDRVALARKRAASRNGTLAGQPDEAVVA